MARMYPTPTQPDTESQAERDLYTEFQRQLDDSYTIIHSATWQYIEGQRRVPRNGEADFVILHPTKGLLIVEVKGGSITRDAQTDTWTSTSRNNQTFDIKNPFEQAKRSMFTILNDLKKDSKLPRGFASGHIVTFPDCTITGALGIDMPREIIIDQHDMVRLAEWIEATYAYYRGRQSTQNVQLGRGTIDLIRQRLMPDVEIHPVLWGDFQRERQEIIRLTSEQFHVLELLGYHNRARICGPGGSGKTLIALEKARRLAAQQFKVLYTCYNTALADDIRTKMGANATFDIIPFHQLCGKLLKSANIKPSGQREPNYFTELLPNALLDALDTVTTRYDAIIVDEGQDFLDAWWLPLQMLLANDAEGVLYIFYDDNQRIYSQERNWPISQVFPLTINCRNTQAIHRTLTKFYTGAPIRVQGPQGRPVSVIRYGAQAEQGSVVGKLLDRLVLQEQVPAKEIVVLSPFTALKSPLWRDPPAGQIRLTELWPPERNRVHYATIHSFKGLERSVVVLADVEAWRQDMRDELTALLYVACSRACHHLYIIQPKKLPPDKRDLLDFSKVATIEP